MGAPEKLYLSEDFRRGRARLRREAQAGQVQGTLIMRKSSDRHPDQPRRQPAAARRPDRRQPPARSRQGRRGHVPEVKLSQAVADVVRRQVAAGISVPGDGEYGKSMGSKVNYRAWWSYSFTRLGGLKIEDIDRDTLPVHRSTPGNTVLSTFADRRDRARFAAAYSDPEFGNHDGPAADELAVRGRAGPLYRPGRHRRRHRQLQGGACGQRCQRGLHDLDRAGELRAHRQSPLQERRRVRLRLRRRHARGIQGDRRRRAGAADRRSGDRRELRPDQSRADGRGLPQVHRAQDRGAEPCAARPAAGPHPLPSLLGQLARPAHDRHPHARDRRR